MEKLDGESKDIVKENIEKLKQIFPEIISEGNIDFDKLKSTLGEYIDDSKDRYNFTWNGKAKAKRLAQMPSTGTLRPCKEESVNWNSTENLFIEGDNLEVLKLLQKTYHKKIKMIYIDPPYNTGKDFIYKDNFKDNIKNYLELTGQLDGEGKKMSANPETSGRYHTDWLNMMYPRLKLARNLLRDDGVIFISVDENEATNLKRICDEIFGEENFLAQLVWKKKYTGGKHAKHYVDMHEYILVYSKNKDDITSVLIDRPDEEKGKFTEIDKYLEERGKYYMRPLKSNLAERPTLVYSILTPDGKEITTQWLVSKNTFERFIEEERIEFRKKRDGCYQVYKKYYEKDGEGKVKVPSLIENFPNTEAKYELKNLFDIKEGRDNIFYTVKPKELIKYIIKPYCSNNGDVVLDFFAGTCTTAHAVFEVAKELGVDLRFICVQLPEIADEDSSASKMGFINVSEIGKERIRKAIKNIEKEKSETLFKDKKLDLGFKVFKLDSSNIKVWDSDFDSLETSLLDSVDNIKKNRSVEDVLYEILLKYGLDLTLPIEERKICKKTVYSIGLGALIVCLDKDISLDVVEGIAKLKEELNPEITRVVFSDTGFKDDVVKTNTIQILKQHGIEDVKSI